MIYIHIGKKKRNVYSYLIIILIITNLKHLLHIYSNFVAGLCNVQPKRGATLSRWTFACIILASNAPKQNHLYCQSLQLYIVSGIASSCHCFHCNYILPCVYVLTRWKHLLFVTLHIYLVTYITIFLVGWQVSGLNINMAKFSFSWRIWRICLYMR